jgi:tryptophanase
MSDEQWASLMRGDEAYIRSRSFFAFEAAVQEVLGFPYVIPTHQGRAAENIVMALMVDPGDIVLSNTHFDTTKAHVQNRQALPVDLVSEAFWNFGEHHDFKGNFDLEKLDAVLSAHHTRVAMVVITVLNNMACSSPVSMENIRETSLLAKRYGVPVFFDACRFAENAYFIKTREKGYADKSIADIVIEMMSFGEGCWVSAKKDAIVNTGGFIAVRDESFARHCQEKLVLYEGFPTYGGLARRDLEAIAVGLKEGIEETYLAHRIRLVGYLGELLEESGLLVSKPIGGSGVFVDVAALYPQLAASQCPEIALFSDFYLEGGVRVGATSLPIRSISIKTGEFVERTFQFARLAIPRRVYGKAHMEYVARIAARVKSRAAQNPGYRVVEKPEVLGHFFAKFAPATT